MAEDYLTSEKDNERQYLTGNERQYLFPFAKEETPLGLCKDLGVDITEGDIDENRRDVFEKFPREDIAN